MTENLRANKNLILTFWWLWSGVLGFLLGGGWKIVANFSEWHSGVFHGDNMEGTALISLFYWAVFGPLPCAVIAISVAGVTLLAMKSRMK